MLLLLSSIPVWLGREKRVQELKVGRPPVLLLPHDSAPRDQRGVQEPISWSVAHSEESISVAGTADKASRVCLPLLAAVIVLVSVLMSLMQLMTEGRQLEGQQQ